MISFCWETVRVHGDPDPGHLEAAIRHVLSKHSGNWRVVVSRTADTWRIRFEQPRDTQGPSAVATTSVATPLPSGAVLRTLVADALRDHA